MYKMRYAVMLLLSLIAPMVFMGLEKNPDNGYGLDISDISYTEPKSLAAPKKRYTITGDNNRLITRRIIDFL